MKTTVSRLSRASRVPLQLLARVAAGDGRMKRPAERLVYEGAKAGTRAAKTIASAFAAAQRLLGAPSRLATPPASSAFDLTPTPVEALAQQTMRRFADEALRPAAAAADAERAAPAALLAQSHALGLCQLAIPESLGGAAESRAHVTGVLVAAELARGDMGLALAALAPLGVVHALVGYGTAAQQARYLLPFAGERFIPAALALGEPRPGFDPMAPRTGAVRADGGWRLYGEKSLVPLGESAELFLVGAEIRGAGPRLFLVEKGAPGLGVAAEPAMGLRAAATSRLTLDGVHVPEDALLGGDDATRDASSAIVARARLAWGALAVGTGQAVLDYVTAYCNERVAFGEAITHRQAVAFMIADIAIELEGMRLLVYRAAALADQGRDIAHAAALVRAQCKRKAAQIGGAGVQLLGGHGFVKEHPVERWYRDLLAVGVMEGALLV